MREGLLYRLGPRDYDRLFYPGYIGESLAIRAKDIIRGLGYCSSDYIKYVDTCMQTTYVRGTVECRRFLAEQMKAKKKHRREYKKYYEERNKQMLLEANYEQNRSKLETTRDSQRNSM